MYCSWTCSCCLMCQCLDVVLSALESNFSFLFSLKDICRQSSSLHRIHLLWDCQVGDSVKQHNASSWYCRYFSLHHSHHTCCHYYHPCFASSSSFCLSNWDYQLILDSDLNSCILKKHSTFSYIRQVFAKGSSLLWFSVPKNWALSMTILATNTLANAKQVSEVAVNC